MFNSYQINTLKFDAEACNGCARCVEVCPHAVFRMVGKRAELATPAACMECGACQLNCATGAITVESGVGCATEMIVSALTGSRKTGCGGSNSTPSCACG